MEHDVTDAELKVLEALWRDGEASVRDLAQQLYATDGSADQATISEHATVQKLLERLRAKGCVDRQRQGRAHLYRATVERRSLIARRLRATADRLCGGSLVPLLTTLVDDRALSQDDLGALRRLVDRLEGVAEPGDEASSRDDREAP